MKGMLKVPQQEYIKYLREFEDLSISEIKETLNINWRTAKKYADKDDWNKPLIKAKRPSPVMDTVQNLMSPQKCSISMNTTSNSSFTNR